MYVAPNKGELSFRKPNFRRINMRLFASLVASFVVALLTAAPAQAELVLAVNEGVTYYVTPMEIREKYKDLAELLGKHLKTTVRIVPVDQYPVLRKGAGRAAERPRVRAPGPSFARIAARRQIPPGGADQGVHGVQGAFLREEGRADEAAGGHEGQAVRNARSGLDHCGDHARHDA